MPSSSASEMTTIEAQSNPILRKTACITCRARKVRCDKVEPCANCTKALEKCEFPSPIRTVNRPSKNAQKLNEARANHKASDNSALWDKLEQLEDLVRCATKDARLPDKNADLLRDQSKEQYVWDADTYALPATANDDTKDEGGRKRKFRKISHLSSFSMNEEGLLSEHPGLSAGRLDLPVSQALGEEIQGVNGFPPDTVRSPPQDGNFQHGHSPSGQDAPLWNTFGQNMIGPSALPAGNLSFGTMPPRPSSSEKVPGARDPLKPDLEQRRMIWAAFVNNVDRCVKVIHKPAMERLLLGPECSDDAHESTTMSLIFAVFLSSVLSMSQDKLTELSRTFSLDGDKLILLYQGALEQALTEANYLESPNLTILQALVLYIYYLKHRDNFKCYTLHSAAFRLALKMSLHRDGSHFDLSVLDTEIRRRLWWNLLLFEDRFAEDHGGHGHWSFGLNPEPDTQFPANIDDLELESVSSSSPTRTPPPEDRSRPGITENTLGIVQFEISQAFRRIRRDRLLADGQNRPRLSLKGAEAILTRSQEVIDAKLFPNDYAQGPFETYIRTAARMILMKRRFMLYQPAVNSAAGVSHLPALVRNGLFTMCTEILARSRMLRKDPKVLRWNWQSAGYFQWHVSEALLEELKVRPISNATGHAWSLLDGMLADWPEGIQKSPKGAQLHARMAITAQALESKRTHMFWYLSPPQLPGNADQLESQQVREHNEGPRNEVGASFDDGQEGGTMAKSADGYGFDYSFDFLLEGFEAPFFPQV